MARLLSFFLLLVSAVVSASPPMICIDPGHPSEVGNGTRGKRSTEIGVAYRIANLLRERLRNDGYRVTLTKTHEQERVTNRRRAEIANASQAKLLLRLHCDAGSGSGFAVYYPSQRGRISGVTGPTLQVIAESAAVARTFYIAMKASLRDKLPSEGLKTDLQTEVGARQGALTGSIFSKVPTLLVEMAVLTNPKDEDWILSKTGEIQMVDSLEAGVKAVVKSTKP